MTAPDILLSISMVIASLYAILAAGLSIKKVRSARVLGAYLGIFALLLFNALIIQFSDANIFLIALSIPLLKQYVHAFFHEKSSRNAFWEIVSGIVIGLVLALHLKNTLTATLTLMVYFTWQFVQIRKIIQTETHARGINLFRNPGKRLSWFRNFILYQPVVALFLVYWFNETTYLGTYWLPVLLAINPILIFSQIFRESAFFSPLTSGQKYAKSSLTPDQKFAILNRLERLMSEEKYYLNDNASLTELSEKLKTSSHNLSQVLNEQKGRTFAEYLMQYRIDEARKLIREDQQKRLKIEEIATRVGYHSKSAFNTAFKRTTGQTPSEFREMKNVRNYREERLAGRTIRYYGNKVDSLDLFKNQIDMVKNFFLIFTRTLKRNKVFTLINLLGLVIGFTSSLFIYLFIQDEMSYDKSISGAENIYRIAWFGGNPQTRTPHPMAQALARDFPEVENAVTLSPWYGSGLSKQNITIRNAENNIQFDEPDFYFVDSTFLDVFDFDLIVGNKETALKQPNGIILNESMANKYFGNDDPLGKRLYIGPDEIPTEVVGVIEDAPRTTHFHYNFLISYVTLKSIMGEDHFWLIWGDFGHFNYIKLRDSSNPMDLETKIPEWFLTYNNWSDGSRASLLDGTNKFKLQRITDIHLHSNIRWELEPNGNILYIYILTAAVLFIITIACINYLNLTTAKSVERAKEIGVRKTLGALRKQLSLQFLTESVLFCVIAGFLAILVAIALLPQFNYLSGKVFSIFHIINVNVLISGLTACLIVGLISGFYPSLALSSFKTTEILKGNFVRSAKGNLLNRILVVIQFVISAILISASLIILKQTNYLKEKPLGFEPDYLIQVPIKRSELRTKHEVVTSELRRQTGVVDATAVSNLPGGQFNQNGVWLENDPQNSINVSELTFDYRTIETLGLNLIEGRNFDKSYASDSAGASFILNEAAVRQLQLNDPLGSKLIWGLEEGPREGYVVGVLKDFHYKSLHQTIQPLIVDMRRSNPGYFLIRIEAENIPAATEAVQSVYEKFDSKHDFEFSFLNQSIDDLYNAEVRTLNIFGIFSIIALILACLGLLGIAISMMNQKVKEVGIRKIHGASSGQILWMINWQFSKLIAIALVVGLPLAYLLMTNWIAEFPYQVSLGVMPFLIAVVVLIGVAFITTSTVVMKVAGTNPADALRYE